MKPRVAIIGAGWAGLAAAVELAPHAQVTVYEAGREPGGRARNVITPAALLDNGQHLLLGAYRECLRMMQRVGIDIESVVLRLPLRWFYTDGLDMHCPQLPAPWHALAGLVSARGLSWRARAHVLSALIRLKVQGWRVPVDQSVASWLAKMRQGDEIIARFWSPLVLSALNTPLALASMQTLAAVLRDSLGAARAHSDYLIPRVGLTELFPGPACDWLSRQGVKLCFATRVRSVESASDGGWLVAGEKFDAVVIAVAPYHVNSLVNDISLVGKVNLLKYYPIYTVYLKFSMPTALPYPLIGVHQGTADWLFDRQKLLGKMGEVAAVISTPEPDKVKNHATLIDGVIADLVKLDPAFTAPLHWAQVIGEKRATFAATPGLSRPKLRLSESGLYLAGDWVTPEYPATLEGAVRSGVAAARALWLDLKQEELT